MYSLFDFKGAFIMWQVGRNYRFLAFEPSSIGLLRFPSFSLSVDVYFASPVSEVGVQLKFLAFQPSSKPADVHLASLDMSQQV
jgi:hypothetical protein